MFRYTQNSFSTTHFIRRMTKRKWSMPESGIIAFHNFLTHIEGEENGNVIKYSYM